MVKYVAPDHLTWNDPFINIDNGLLHFLNALSNPKLSRKYKGV